MHTNRGIVMSEQAQIVSSIYDSSSPEVQELIDTLYRKWGAEDFRLELLQKAKRIRPREQTKATNIKSDLSDIWKACREDGTAPDTEQVTTLWTTLQALNKEIRKGQNDKHCGPKDRKVYSDAVKVYREDERALLVTLKGEDIQATKTLDPAVLARIEAKRKAQRESNNK